MASSGSPVTLDLQARSTYHSAAIKRSYRRSTSAVLRMIFSLWCVSQSTDVSQYLVFVRSNMTNFVLLVNKPQTTQGPVKGHFRRVVGTKPGPTPRSPMLLKRIMVFNPQISAVQRHRSQPPILHLFVTILVSNQKSLLTLGLFRSSERGRSVRPSIVMHCGPRESSELNSEPTTPSSSNFCRRQT